MNLLKKILGIKEKEKSPIKNILEISPELENKIQDAWATQAASACNWVEREIDKFSKALLNNQNIKIGSTGVILDNMEKFLIWKNSLGIDIPILKYSDIIEKIIEGNNLVETFNIDKIIFEKVHPIQDYYKLTLMGELNNFSVFLGKILNSDFTYGINIEVSNLKFLYVKPNQYCVIFDDNKNQETLEIEFDKFEIK